MAIPQTMAENIKKISASRMDSHSTGESAERQVGVWKSLWDQESAGWPWLCLLLLMSLTYLPKALTSQKVGETNLLSFTKLPRKDEKWHYSCC